MNKEDIRHILQQPYEAENWRKVFNFVFPNVSFLSNPTAISFNSEKVESFKQIGSVRLNDGKTLAMFEIRVLPNVNIPRNRVELRNLVAPLIDQERNHGVLVIYEQGREDYRFTFTARETAFDEDKADFVSRETASKRFTYMLGSNESCRTPGDRFWELSQKKNVATIKDVENAFSVERLSKEFFPKYKQHYLNFVDYLNNSNFRVSAFEGDEKKIRDFVKVMLGRIVFLHFVQKKGWLGATDSNFADGNPNFLQEFWEQSGKNENFYFEHLSRLFFQGLNNPDRTDNQFLMSDGKTSRCVPFLGGGLFEKHRYEPDLVTFPKELFENLFNFFAEYNFTIDENDPYENEVGIDPEMLGHIFENLLEDNKDKGAFYTPKPIVKYMCQESLIQYLLTRLEQNGVFSAESADKDDFEIKVGNFVRKYEARDVIEYDDILTKALHSVKVCDPAIGSGAFPMGILNEMVMLINVLHQANPDVVEQTWQMDNWQPATVKKHIIQNSIYGVDIEKGAVDIARLRFWLSLIIDEDHPEALPSLDYKIVVGNSLLSMFEDEVIDIEWDSNISGSVTNQSVKMSELVDNKRQILQSIAIKQKRFFSAEKSLKDSLKIEIRNLKLDLLLSQLTINKENFIENNPLKGGFMPTPKEIQNNLHIEMETDRFDKLLLKLHFLKNNTNEQFEHFDWKLDFPEVMNLQVASKAGFDIVIGNPPYVEAKKLKHISSYLKNYRVYTGTSDLSSYFFELGINLIKENGLLCLINTNKFFNTGYGQDVRLLILENEIKQLLNFEQVEVFEGILVSSVIISIKKKAPQTPNEFPYKKFFKLKNTEFLKRFGEEINSPNLYLQSQLTDKEWSFADNSNLTLKAKIELDSIAIEDLNEVYVFRGVTTGYNPAFLISNEVKNELINRESKNSEIIKPLLQGRNIRKWIYNFDNQYFIFTRQGIVIDSYPSIKDYLLRFYSELKPRTGDEKVGRKPGSYKWYEIQDNTAYYQEFNKPKIIWGLTADKWAFAFDDKGHFLPSNGYILTSNKTPVKYLLALLNSNLLRYYFGFIGVMTAGGAFTLKHSTIQKLPIKIAKNPSVFIDIVDDILNDKAQNQTIVALERKLDNLVYKLYDLNYEEVKVIDPEFALSEEEYLNIKLEE